MFEYSMWNAPGKNTYLSSSFGKYVGLGIHFREIHPFIERVAFKDTKTKCTGKGKKVGNCSLSQLSYLYETVFIREKQSDIKKRIKFSIESYQYLQNLLPAISQPGYMLESVTSKIFYS